MIDYSFPRYLESKTSIDDRALNGRVWDTLWQELPTASRLNPLQILEIGAGTGTMIGRILHTNRLSTAMYTAIDADEENISALKAKRQAWTATHPYFMVMAEATTAESFAQQAADSDPFDLLIANAFLDLVDLPTTLTQLFNLLKPNALFYFSINFDGQTIFEPATSLGRAFDQQVIDAYHGTMHNPHTGRQLFHHIQQAGGQLLAAGSSDWVVFGQNGVYPADEAYFLHHILHFFETSLTNHPALDPTQFTQWLTERHQQIENGQLVYIAHQLDLLGRLGSPNPAETRAANRAAAFRAAMHNQ